MARPRFKVAGSWEKQKVVLIARWSPDQGGLYPRYDSGPCNFHSPKPKSGTRPGLIRQAPVICSAAAFSLICNKEISPIVFIYDNCQELGSDL